MENTIGESRDGSVGQVGGENREAAMVIRIATTILNAGIRMSEEVSNEGERRQVLVGVERLVTDIINTELGNMVD